MVSLAEIVNVYEHSALIGVYAGMSELDYDNMVAIPLSHGEYLKAEKCMIDKGFRLQAIAF